MKKYGIVILLLLGTSFFLVVNKYDFVFQTSVSPETKSKEEESLSGFISNTVAYSEYSKKEKEIIETIFTAYPEIKLQLWVHIQKVNYPPL